MRSTSDSQSGIGLGFAGQIPQQPELGEPPVTLHGIDGNVQRRGCFLQTRAGEETQLDDLCLPWVNRLQPTQRVVQLDEMPLRRERYLDRQLQRHPSSAPASLAAFVRTR